MFDADRPITSSDQDRLGRTTFAKYLARCILDHKSIESLVIGLYGGWGVGKTSIINLMLEELRYAASNMLENEMPIILNFSPWSYSGQNQLIFSFFRRLSSELRSAPHFKNSDSEKIIHLLELYVSFFTHKPVPKLLRPKHTIVGKAFKRKQIIKETYGWESGRDLTQVKAELNTLLSKQKHKIIIIIDNISRLENSEIKQIFQIVKSMGDYANTVYLLAFDKEHIIHALHEMDGKEFLEKIVQLPFEVPPISKQDIEALLMDRLQRIVDNVPTELWDKNCWADLYYSAIKYFFKNVRDITHYVNTLSFSYPHVKDVVNPVDYFAITALEVFEPQVYAGIRGHKDLFTDLMDNVYRLDAEKIAEDKLRCDEILNRAQNISHELLVKLLIRLFPRLRALYDHVPFYHAETSARKNLKICSPDVFDVYFRLSIPTGVIPESEMDAILGMVKDEGGFALALLRLNHDGKIIKFLDLLDSRDVTKIPTHFIGNAINALLDSADIFPEGENTLLSFTTPMRVHRIIHQLLYRIEDGEQRFELFREAIKKSVNSIYIIIHELDMQAEEQYRAFSTTQLDTLQKLAVAKILSWAETGRLIDHPKLIPILYAWKAWGDGDECKRYVSQVTQNDQGLLAFLTAIFKTPIDEAITKLKVRSEWNTYLSHVENFISAKVLEPHVILLFEDLGFEKLREREQLAILIFLNVMNARTTKIIPKTF